MRQIKRRPKLFQSVWPWPLQNSLEDNLSELEGWNKPKARTNHPPASQLINEDYKAFSVETCQNSSTAQGNYTCMMVHLLAEKKSFFFRQSGWPSDTLECLGLQLAYLITTWYVWFSDINMCASYQMLVKWSNGLLLLKGVKIAADESFRDVLAERMKQSDTLCLWGAIRNPDDKQTLAVQAQDTTQTRMGEHGFSAQANGAVRSRLL